MSAGHARSFEEIDSLVKDAEVRLNFHHTALQNDRLTRKEKIYHVRQYKGLEGVIMMGNWVVRNRVSRSQVLGE